MDTIVKGKYIERKYVFNGQFMSLWFSKNYDTIENLKQCINDIKNWKEELWIITKDNILDWETFFKADYLEFSLAIGDSIFIEDMSYKIEKVEGTDDNTIIYYVDKVINIIEDIESLNRSKESFGSYKKILSTDNQNSIELKEQEIKEFYEKQYRQKWYQFWKLKQKI